MNKPKIFIVDDDPFYLELLKFEISNLSLFDVSGFTSAEDCLCEMKNDPALIILDYNLTEDPKNKITGHNALELFKKENPKQKVIFISSEQNWEILEAYNKFREVKYMIKSEFLSQQLKNTLLQMSA